jgi:membrane-associated phospholipid phosphatase
MLNQTTHLDQKVKLSTSSYVLTKFARCVTNLTAPPFLAIPSFVILGLQEQQRQGTNHSRLGLSLIIALAFGAILPVVIVVILHLLKKVSDVHIADRRQRTLPFLLSISCFATGTLLLWLCNGSGWLTAILACYTVNTLVVMIINFWWKISVHATGVGGPIAAFALIIGMSVLAPLIGLVCLIAWARVYLRAHTLGQVLAGSLLGFSFTMFQLLFVFHLVN